MVTQRSITLGDRVRFTLGVTPLEGIVIEDRGKLGVGGERIFRIQVPNDPYEDTLIELPEDALTLVTEPGGPPLSGEEMVEYLKMGGLKQLLRANLPGEDRRMAAWLTRDPLGNVVHTFYRERGLTPGGFIPFLALRHNQIFSPKLEEVKQFLAAFGLEPTDIEEIIQTIGTAP